MTELNGTVGPGSEPVRAAVEHRLRHGGEAGLPPAVDADGHHAVDLRGGHRDAARTRPWRRDTVTHVRPVTNTATRPAASLPADGGEPDVRAPVARHRPASAANGTRHVEVRHPLSHGSGPSGPYRPARAARRRLPDRTARRRQGGATAIRSLRHGRRRSARRRFGHRAR
ncbi:serine hydrolase [Streptomyces sp. NPDC085946]|uniref:serine hydrolase n=1 Tax=Streptomyces sp. NPDC085946 TaxID=3365744 RepID=UPI0037D3C925